MGPVGPDICEPVPPKQGCKEAQDDGAPQAGKRTGARCFAKGESQWQSNHTGRQAAIDVATQVRCIEYDHSKSFLVAKSVRVGLFTRENFNQREGHARTIYANKSGPCAWSFALNQFGSGNRTRNNISPNRPGEILCIIGCLCNFGNIKVFTRCFIRQMCINHVEFVGNFVNVFRE